MSLLDTGSVTSYVLPSSVLAAIDGEAKSTGGGLLTGTHLMEMEEFLAFLQGND